MIATSVQQTAQAPAAHASRNVLAGTSTLIRFILRRDRIKLGAWLLGLTALLTIFLNALTELTRTEEQRQDLLRVMEGGVGAIFGPGYGRYDITAERYVVGVYGLFFFILAALMSMQLVSRHTRVEEQSGRAELVRSNVVGRHAQLTATLIVVAGANVVLALMLAGTMVARGHDGGDGLLFGASVGAVGLVFAGITALTVQVTEYSRTATGISGAVLGVAWAIRAAGDMISDYGSPLSWFSPLAWSNQTRPFVDGRWWPLLLSVGLAMAAAATGYVLSARRDVGAGMIAVRPGTPVAASWLRSPLTLAFRLQRSSVMWWTVALAAFGFIFGAMGDEVADPDQMSQSRIEMFGGSVETLLDGYLGMMSLFMAVVAGIMLVLGVQALRSEETEGRAEPLLATAISRWGWFGGYLAVMSLGLVGALFVAGLATGAGTAVAVGDGSYVWEVTLAYLAHAPGTLVMLGIAALMFGVYPRAIGLAWIVVGYIMFVGLFGTTMDLPRWAVRISPMEHVGRPPLDNVSWAAALILLAIAAGLMALGMAGFRRRDLETK
jgi:ABC-2 type transport system permease protein